VPRLAYESAPIDAAAPTTLDPGGAESAHGDPFEPWHTESPASGRSVHGYDVRIVGEPAKNRLDNLSRPWRQDLGAMGNQTDDWQTV